MYKKFERCADCCAPLDGDKVVKQEASMRACAHVHPSAGINRTVRDRPPSFAVAITSHHSLVVTDPVSISRIRVAERNIDHGTGELVDHILVIGIGL